MSTCPPPVPSWPPTPARSTAAASSCSSRRRPAGAVLAAVDGYRNPDGGYGWGLEPDLRATESQPGGRLPRLRGVRGRRAPPTTPARRRAVRLAGVGHPARRRAAVRAAGRRPRRRARRSGRRPTRRPPRSRSRAFVAGTAHRVAAPRPGRRRAPAGWRARPTYCLAAIDALGDAPFAIALAAAAAVPGRCRTTSRPEAARAARAPRARSSPPTGGCHVRRAAPRTRRCARSTSPPFPDRPARDAVQPRTSIDAELRAPGGPSRTTAGGASTSRATRRRPTLEWRGYATVRALSILLRN